MFSLVGAVEGNRNRNPGSSRSLGGVLLFQDRREIVLRRAHWSWLAALIAPVAPLTACTRITSSAPASSSATPNFYANTQRQTSTLPASRSVSASSASPHDAYEHVVPVVCMDGRDADPCRPRNTRKTISTPALKAIGVILLANWVAFSILGGALPHRIYCPCTRSFLARLREYMAATYS